MRLSLLPLFVFSALLNAPSVLSGKVKCKCMPGDSCFPSAKEWAAFSKTLSKPLIVGQRPIGAVCYPGEASFNAEACTTLQAKTTDDVYLSGLINGLHRLNFDSLVNSTTIESCPYSPAANATCHQGRVPPYAVNVTSASDVQSAVRFASKHNLRLVVKNSGHEGMGRPFGVGALELFMFHLKDISFSDKFVPKGAPRKTPKEFALTVGAGVSWGAAYAAADANNRSIVGGMSPQGTVGAAAGWPMGGGHSIISPFHGLGVDNALQFVVVRPDASVVTINKYTDPDHFWAIRGGGGPSFGIVISTTYRTHPNVAYTAQYFGAAGATPEAYRSLLTVWMKYHNPLVDAGWGGLWPFVNTSLFLSFVAQNNPPSQSANQTMEAFIKEARALPGVFIIASANKGYRSFNEYFTNNLIDISKLLGVDFRSVVPSGVQDASSSWLMPRDTTAPANAANFANILANSTLLGLPFTVAGGRVSEIDPDSAAVTPAWRRAVVDITFVSAAGADEDIRTHYELVHKTIQPYRALAPPPYGGQYLNEADILEPEWQKAYWGSHYPRLLSIKKQLDPKDLLIVRKGVNSEAWDDEIICKRT